ncbi:hypothetical protein A5653_02805 [Mycobacterium colombiense]|uniref:hypothetical protein n=1 Tax=Mycobacterium colombiense TaxID=339268 RepID=UPI0007EF0C40|nr:hypothetical protein [Mycobacterium colombiense]OBK65855.1 hypothetical protein A5653_02805 [Mycobacterium colombiense]
MRKNSATTVTPQSHVSLPAPPPGFDGGEWRAGRILSRDETRAWRLVYRHAQKVTDHDAYACVRAIQYSDGSLDEVEILANGADSDSPLNSDQARELAAALLESAAEVDRWTE